jgi:hypothetical protein
LQKQTEVSLFHHFHFLATWRHQTESGRHKPRQFSLIRLPIYSLCKWKFVIYPFDDEEKNLSYPLKNGLNGLKRLAQQWKYVLGCIDMYSVVGKLLS